MAGTPLGDSSPASIPLSGVPRRTLHLVQPATRTRRNHGVFMIGDELASVYSAAAQRQHDAGAGAGHGPRALQRGRRGRAAATRGGLNHGQPDLHVPRRHAVLRGRP
jgi:hypothetical protein